MANEVNLNLDPRAFMGIVPERKAAIEAAPDTPIPADYPVNRLSRAFHPKDMALLIEDIEVHGDDTKSYTLVPDKANGTESLAYFSAGQYISVYLEIGGSKLYKPYSIRSAPADALKGRYVITVKGSDGGFASLHILNNWKTGDTVTVAAPEGGFTFEPLRDPKDVVGLAGGSGITPFYSLACAIADGTEDCRLTLLYGSRKAGDILLKKEFETVTGLAPDKIKVIHILSDEAAAGYESGFITAELIKKYAPQGDYALFICGPQVMYDHLDKEIAKLNIPKRRVRHELFGQVNDPSRFDGYPAELAGKSFALNVRVRSEEKQYQCKAGESLLVALERAGIAVPSRCRSGECGFCHTRLISGKVFIPQSEDKRREADAIYNYIHPCITFPMGDVSLEISI